MQSCTRTMTIVSYNQNGSFCEAHNKVIIFAFSGIVFYFFRLRFSGIKERAILIRGREELCIQPTSLAKTKIDTTYLFEEMFPSLVKPTFPPSLVWHSLVLPPYPPSSHPISL